MYNVCTIYICVLYSLHETSSLKFPQNLTILPELLKKSPQMATETMEVKQEYTQGLLLTH